MKRIVKPTATDVAVAAMREELQKGVWRERVPGTRVMAKRLGLSPPTVAAALSKLVDEGFLERGGERRAFKLAGIPRGLQKMKPPSKSKRLLILTHDELERLVDTSRRIIEKLRNCMVDHGWEVTYQVVDFMHVKRPQRSWDRTIQVAPGTSVIALYGRPALAAWAIRRKLRIFFLGGVTDGLPVSQAAVRSSKAGLRIPEDVSVVLLNDQMEADWFYPPLSRFRLPLQRIVSEMVRWLEDDSGQIRNILMTADFIEGDSVGPPKY